MLGGVYRSRAVRTRLYRLGVVIVSKERGGTIKGEQKEVASSARFVVGVESSLPLSLRERV